MAAAPPGEQKPAYSPASLPASPRPFAPLKTGSRDPRRFDVLTFRRRDTYTCLVMAQLKRATVYLDPSLHKALRVKAAHTDRTLSELVNAAVRQTLAEDARDLAVFAERAREPALSFEEVLKDLRRRGKL